MTTAKFLLAGCGALAIIASSQPSFAEMKDGVETSRAAAGSTARIARKGFTDFDPPSSFEETLPLDDAPYLNPKMGMWFSKGGGALLNELGNFGITGYSPPNFLAWNCEVHNSNDSVPKLPAVIKLLQPAKSFSLKFGSRTSAGKQVMLQALDSGGKVLATSKGTVAAAMKTLSVSARNIRSIRLSGPCILVADDLKATF